ncbi:hypothetical protein AMECASPLE_018148 [Ameca splendens]|uniref:Uncharacterized protein n=1 Tax=Ameca splendens TaxID=208324 RepID=A0ABV0ZZU8_9TELE
MVTGIDDCLLHPIINVKSLKDGCPYNVCTFNLHSHLTEFIVPQEISSRFYFVSLQAKRSTKDLEVFKVNVSVYTLFGAFLSHNKPLCDPASKLLVLSFTLCSHFSFYSGAQSHTSGRGISFSLFLGAVIIFQQRAIAFLA